MSLTVYGVTNSTGEYQGRTYNNLVFNCLKPSEKGVGQDCEVVKVKYSNCNYALSLVTGVLDEFVGRTIKADYNKFGQVETINLVDEV